MAARVTAIKELHKLVVVAVAPENQAILTQPNQVTVEQD
jgi:hypothetical protein